MVNKLNNIIQNYIVIFIFNFLFITFLCPAYADLLHHSNLDSNKTTIRNINTSKLNKLSLDDLKLLKKNHQIILDKHKNTNSDQKHLENNLLVSLLTYDSTKLQISDVISVLVEEYNVVGKYKSKLLGYSDTFNSMIKPMQNTIKTLEDYRNYDERFSVVYVSLLYALKEDVEFYEQYSKDIKNPSTTIGKYKRKLDYAFTRVKNANYEYKIAKLIGDTKKVILQIEREINKREIVFLKNSPDEYIFN